MASASLPMLCAPTTDTHIDAFSHFYCIANTALNTRFPVRESGQLELGNWETGLYLH